MQEPIPKSIAPVLKLLGITDGADLSLQGVSYDSREVKPGYAFCCINGQHVDGNKFIADAIAHGAACIFSTSPKPAGLAVPYFAVADVELALALVADHMFDHPSQKLRPLGITGTNGKTTTTHLVEHILNFAGSKTGLIGTLGARFPGQDDYQNIKQHTTPQSSDLHRILAAMVEAGCTHVAMEVSSHALVQKRVGACQFALACLTNVTQDHLDFHQTMDNYWQSKRRLFEILNDTTHDGKSAIVNADDPLAQEFLKVVGPSVRPITYGWEKGADIYVKKAQFDFDGTKASLATPLGDVDMKLKLTGRFNIYNTMAAVAICLAEGVDLDTCKQALEEFSGVAGRFEVISTNSGHEPLCIVDYAHTPDGLDNVLKTARNLVPQGGKLIVVFGCGGDRDASKRPQMGEIAEARADEVIITSDNPRSEDSQVIISNILAGIKRLQGVIIEPDRSTAIRYAVDNASDQDIIVIAGKGHENYQILADRTIPFDDRVEVKLALQDRSHDSGNFGPRESFIPQ